MKYMFASDVHGSAYYCRLMLEKYNEEKAERLVLLGDLLYHGAGNELPREYDPRQVASMLNGVKDRIFCVRGNCDAESDQAALEFPMLADYGVFPWGKRLVYVTHGHRFNLQNLPPLQPGDILMHGHTHVPAWQEFGAGSFYVNPGSVSLPKENSAHGYLLLTPEGGQWKDLSGNLYHELEL